MIAILSQLAEIKALLIGAQSLLATPPQLAILAARHAGLLAPLVVVCLCVLIAIPMAAAKGKLHMPGYSGLFVLLLVVALLFGYAAARPSISGHAIGAILSFIFFVLLAAAIGCILALAFYRRKPVAETESRL